MNPFKEQPRSEWLKDCKNLYFLCTIILSTAFADKFNNFGKLHKLLCAFLMNREIRKKLISVFRGSYKTTVLLGYCVGLFVWHLKLGKPISICYNTATKENAENFMNDFKRCLTECVLLQDIFPEITTNPERAFDLWQKYRVEYKWVKFHISSLVTKQVSRHYIVYINDDLVDDDNAYSEVERTTVIRKWRFQKSIVTRYEKFKVGTEIDCGTPYHSLDLMSALMAREMGEDYEKFIIPYSMDDNGKCWNPHMRRGALSFPEVYTWADFDKTFKEQQERIFSTQYRLKVTEESDVICKMEWLKYYDTANLPNNYIRHMVIDPAGTEKTENSATGITICDFDERGTIYVIYATEERLTPYPLIREIEKLKDQFCPDQIYIEREKYSITILDTVEHLAPKLNMDFVFPEMNRTTRRFKSKTDRIRRLKQYFEKGRMLLNKNQDRLRYQLLEYPSGDMDILDSLAYQLQVMEVPKKGQERTEDIDTRTDFDKEIETMLAHQDAYANRDNMDASF